MFHKSCISFILIFVQVLFKSVYINMYMTFLCALTFIYFFFVNLQNII